MVAQDVRLLFLKQLLNALENSIPTLVLQLILPQQKILTTGRTVIFTNESLYLLVNLYPGVGSLR